LTEQPERQVGHLQHEKTQQATLREKLLSHYKKNRQFRSEFTSLAEKHRPILLKEEDLQLENGPLQRADWEIRQIGAVAIAFGNLSTFLNAHRWRYAIQARMKELGGRWRDHVEQRQLYFEEMEALAFHWGLRSAWSSSRWPLRRWIGPAQPLRSSSGRG
jgi:hypothetical protein